MVGSDGKDVNNQKTDQDMGHQDMDYQELGLMVGLEIHQQLDTNKLFCSCPSLIREEGPDRRLKRVLRASAGETGDVDIAAKSEMEKQKYFLFEYYEDTNCLVELDEEPPHPINKDALNIVLQIAKTVEAKIVDEVHVMRKTVVDGSNVSGFQRTALIARNGMMQVDLADGRVLPVKVEVLLLEEDAARIIEKNKEFDTYRLDRLGIPLIEFATGPDMHTPQEAKETAAYIGMLLRSTGRVKRGLGTIRQDVNVSISGGARAEIKGVQDLRLLDKVVELEALRQLRMLRLREEMKERKLKADDFSDGPRDVSGLFSGTQSKFIRKGLDEGQRLFAKPYKNFKGFFGYTMNPGRRFGTELSDHIKLLGLNGLIHTDEDLEKYKMTIEVKQAYDESGLGPGDSMIFILGPQDKCIAAFKRIDFAISEFLEKGLSREVRNARDDATSSFMRPMPGSSRMYPETDVPTLVPDISGIEKPELIKDKIARFEKQYMLPRQVAKEVIFEDFEYYAKKYPQIKPITIAETLVSTPKDLQKRFDINIEISADIANAIFSDLNAGNIESSSIPELLKEYALGKYGIGETIQKFRTVGEDEVVEYITKIISEHPQFNSNAIMGLVMKQYRGKFSGQKIQELIKKFKGE